MRLLVNGPSFDYRDLERIERFRERKKPVVPEGFRQVNRLFEVMGFDHQGIKGLAVKESRRPHLYREPSSGSLPETFDLSNLHGYKTGGTIHINNQIGSEEVYTVKEDYVLTLDKFALGAISHELTDACYVIDKSRRYDDLMRKNAAEDKMRKETPALQNAWEKYQTLLNLCR